LSVRRPHADQPLFDAALVHRLIAWQHPQWAGLPIERVASAGTTNAVYRLGLAVAVRLPLVRYGERAIDVDPPPPKTDWGSREGWWALLDTNQ
jgi:aminoglycoside phosphotransferase (APT) family kinase protein